MFVVQKVHKPVHNVCAVVVGNCGGGHFDAASFVGGIILAVSVTVIAYFGFRYWQARKYRIA